jgi:hypothetical protein
MIPVLEAWVRSSSTMNEDGGGRRRGVHDILQGRAPSLEPDNVSVESNDQSRAAQCLLCAYRGRIGGV